MMNRLVILLVVAVAVVMCSVPSEGIIKSLFNAILSGLFLQLINNPR